MKVQNKDRKDTQSPRGVDRLTELLMDPTLSFSEAQAVLDTERQARGDDAKPAITRGNQASPRMVAC